MNLEMRKKMFSVLAGLSIGASALSQIGEKQNNKKTYYIISPENNNINIYETDDIYYSNGKYHFFTSDGYNYAVDTNSAIITENKKEVEDYTKLFKGIQNISVIFVGKEKEKKSTRRK